jgi:hypothetical protein
MSGKFRESKHFYQHITPENMLIEDLHRIGASAGSLQFAHCFFVFIGAR